MGLPKTLIFTSVLVAWLAYAIYTQPLPDGYKQPWKAKTILFLVEEVDDIARFMEMLGFSSRAEATRYIHKTVAPGVDGENLRVTDEVFDGVPVRIYVPKSVGAKSPGKKGRGAPAFVYYHGGGWTIGGIEIYGPVTSYLADKLNAVVVSVDYRMAPENIFPAAFDDCLAATEYFLQHASKYGVDSSRVAVGGDSAGGNLAAAISLKLRDTDFPVRPKLQVLIYPCVQMLDLTLPSFQQNLKGPILNREYFQWMVSNYVSGGGYLAPYLSNNSHVSQAVRQAMAASHLNHKDLPSSHFYSPYSPPDLSQGDPEVWGRYKDVLLNPYMAPLLAKHHRDLPEAYIFTAQYDILRDEGFLYAKRLLKAGIKVTHKHDDIGFHGMISFLQKLPEATQVIQDIVDYLKKVL